MSTIRGRIVPPCRGEWLRRRQTSLHIEDVIGVVGANEELIALHDQVGGSILQRRFGDVFPIGAGNHVQEVRFVGEAIPANDVSNVQFGDRQPFADEIAIDDAYVYLLDEFSAR